MNNNFFQDMLYKRSIEEGQTITIGRSPLWMNLIVSHLERLEFEGDLKKAKKFFFFFFKKKARS